MTRFIAVVLLGLGMTLPAFAADRALSDGSLPPQLRSGTITIEGDLLHLGDIWDNIGDKADRAVANAPAPGKHAILDAHWLAAVASANHVDWSPSSPFERVSVERAGKTIGSAVIETQIREALDAEGLPQGSGFEVTGRESLRIVIPVDQSADIAIRDLVIDGRTQRFSATVEVPAGSPLAQRVHVSGRTFTVVKLPALTRTVPRGEVITERDIQWIEVRDEAVRPDIATEVSQIAGKEPRFSVRAGAPVRLSDLQRALLINRNATVTMMVKTPFMTLTSQGTAMDDGGKGDIIKVTNTQTRQVIEARVEGPNMVTVTPGGPRIAAN